MSIIKLGDSFDGDGQLSTSFIFSDLISSSDKNVEIQIELTGASGDSDKAEVYQFNSMSTTVDTEGKLLGTITLDDTNKVIKSFILFTFNEVKIGLRMVSASSETPNYFGVYSIIGTDTFFFNGIDIVNDTNPQLGGNLDLNDKSIALSFPLTDDHTVSGHYITANVDVNATGIGAALFMAADGNFEEADANAVSTSPCVALAMEAGTGSKKVLLFGVFRDDTWDWNTGAGELGIVFLSATTGALTQTPPSGSGDIVQVVGVALDADHLWFKPQLNVIELL